MAQFLGLTILSFVLSAILLVPFIDFLYNRMKFRRQKQLTKDMFNQRTPIFDKFHSWKAGTPFGGGILIIFIVTLVTLWAYGLFSIEINPWKVSVILFTFISFGLLGLYDDIKKLSGGNSASVFFGLRFRHKFIIQWILAFIISYVIFWQLGYSFIFIRGIGLTNLGFLYVIFSAFVIVSFANAFNIADGLDGLASGLLLICLGAFLAISSTQLDQSVGIFIAVLMGSVAAFLYFNIYRARLWLGDVGSLSLGASLAVIGLLSGKIIALGVIGGVFVLEVGSSLLQILAKKYMGRKVFPASPLHLYLH